VAVLQRQVILPEPGVNRPDRVLRVRDRVPVAEGEPQSERLLLAVQRPGVVALLHEELGHPVERGRGRRLVTGPVEVLKGGLQVVVRVRYLTQQRASVREVEVGVPQGQWLAQLLRRGERDPPDGEEVMQQARTSQEHGHGRGDLPAVGVQVMLDRAGQQRPDHGQLRVAPGPGLVVGPEVLGPHARSRHVHGRGQRRPAVAEGYRGGHGPQVVVENPLQCLVLLVVGLALARLLRDEAAVRLGAGEPAGNVLHDQAGRGQLVQCAVRFRHVRGGQAGGGRRAEIRPRVHVQQP
jgi:hypothetical protein